MGADGAPSAKSGVFSRNLNNAARRERPGPRPNRFRTTFSPPAMIALPWQRSEGTWDLLLALLSLRAFTAIGSWPRLRQAVSQVGEGIQEGRIRVGFRGLLFPLGRLRFRLGGGVGECRRRRDQRRGHDQSGSEQKRNLSHDTPQRYLHRTFPATLTLCGKSARWKSLGRPIPLVMPNFLWCCRTYALALGGPRLDQSRGPTARPASGNRPLNRAIYRAGQGLQGAAGAGLHGVGTEGRRAPRARDRRRTDGGSPARVA